MGLPHLRWKFLFTCWACVLLLAAAFGQSGETTQRNITKVAEDVYMIRHADAPNGFPQGNTTVIIGSNSVLVVDACYLPASAKEDIAAIRRLTSKPVAYLVNTHYHLDHTNGNAAYREAFPAISIIGREDTRYLIEKNNKMEVERTKNHYQLLQTSLALGKDTAGKPLTAADKERIATTLANEKPVQEGFSNLQVVSSNLIMQDELQLNLGNCTVRIAYLGRGNTIADLVVFLPKERIVVAGDLVVHPVPYAYLGYPSQWKQTLRKIVDLEPAFIIPGHGGLLMETGYVKDLIALLDLVVARVEEEIFRSSHTSRFPKIIAGIEAVERSIDWKPWRDRMCKGIKENEEAFDDSIKGGLLRAAFAELEAR